MIKLFSHSFYTITGKYHEKSAILPVGVNLAVLRIAIAVRIPVSGIVDSYDSWDKWKPGFNLKQAGGGGGGRGASSIEHGGTKTFSILMAPLAL